VGPRMKLPRYVHGFVDRHGKPRFYFRHPGFESVPLPGVCTENSDSDVLMMQSADHGMRHDVSDPLNRAGGWRILVQ
jgi:hypothetical protein